MELQRTYKGEKKKHYSNYNRINNYIEPFWSFRTSLLVPCLYLEVYIYTIVYLAGPLFAILKAHRIESTTPINETVITGRLLIIHWCKWKPYKSHRVRIVFYLRGGFSISIQRLVRKWYLFMGGTMGLCIAGRTTNDEMGWDSVRDDLVA